MWCNHMYIYIYIVYMHLLIPKEAIDAPSIWFGFQASFWWCRSSCHWDTPSLIDDCHIPCYGAKAPINQSFLGNIYIHIIIHVYIYIFTIYIYIYCICIYIYIIHIEPMFLVCVPSFNDGSKVHRAWCGFGCHFRWDRWSASLKNREPTRNRESCFFFFNGV
jgi:hypothetical protein